MNYDASIVKEKVKAYVIGEADKMLADVSAPSMRDMICQLGDDYAHDLVEAIFEQRQAGLATNLAAQIIAGVTLDMMYELTSDTH